MEINEAVKILKEHNQWRLGNEKYQAQNPKDITKAIIVVCDYVEKNRVDEEFMKIRPLIINTYIYLLDNVCIFKSNVVDLFKIKRNGKIF